MAACIHGDVCRAWMRQTGSIAPLRASCPNCPWFEPKYPLVTLGLTEIVCVIGKVAQL